MDAPLFTLQSPYPQPKVKLLPLRDQPAYRVTANAAACSLTELLSAVIGGPQQIGTAEALLGRFGGDIRRIHHAHVAEIASVRNIGQQTAVRIKAALALGLRLNDPAEERPAIHSPADAAALVQDMSLLEQEYLKVILLDTRNRVIGIEEIYHGSINCSQVRVGELFKAAIARNAAAIIAVHNHPSGDNSPSPDDIAVTRALVQAGKLMDLQVLDHLIIGNAGRFASLRERGLGFDSTSSAF